MHCSTIVSPLSQTVVGGPGISTVMPTVLGYTESDICRLTTCSVHRYSRVKAEWRTLPSPLSAETIQLPASPSST